jgi:hypothetical protein
MEAEASVLFHSIKANESAYLWLPSPEVRRAKSYRISLDSSVALDNTHIVALGRYFFCVWL